MIRWVYINRAANTTRLIIPGWSILPSYFNHLFPNENLRILAPFLAKNTQTEYVKTHLPKGSTLHETPIQTVLNQDTQTIAIFSMGLQWVMTHAPVLFEQPCDILSPSVTYCHHDVARLKIAIQTSKKVALHAFYKQCFSSNQYWMQWKQQHHRTHLDYNDPNILMDWLTQYGHVTANIPTKSTITLWMDESDPIGKNPTIPNNPAITIHYHSQGHLILPPLIEKRA